MKALLLLFAAIFCIGPIADHAHAQHAGDILVGARADGSLAGVGAPQRTLFLSAVSSGSFQGWSSTALGFDAVVQTNSANAVNPLAAGANVHLEVVSIDPGLSLRSFTAPAQVFADEAGDQLRIGSTGNLHNHPIVFMDRAVVGADFTGSRTVRFRLVDLGPAKHLPSSEYSLTFAPITSRLALSRIEAGFEISVPTQVGLVYQIESASETAGPWTKLGGPIIGTVATESFTLSPSNDLRLFRARVVADN